MGESVLNETDPSGWYGLERPVFHCWSALHVCGSSNLKTHSAATLLMKCNAIMNSCAMKNSRSACV